MGCSVLVASVVVNDRVFLPTRMVNLPLLFTFHYSLFIDSRHHTGYADGKQSCRHDGQEDVDYSIRNMHIGCKGNKNLR